ncbi:hypothetical protein GM30_09120 [Trabulsiella odontotermitis]|nr:hypothetical protein GM30_09120 [Trabulsiella odontotermitis]
MKDFNKYEEFHTTILAILEELITEHLPDDNKHFETEHEKVYFTGYHAALYKFKKMFNRQKAIFNIS